MISPSRFPEDLDKSLGTMISELQEDLTNFARTRYQTLRAEMKEKITAWKTALPMTFIAAAFAVVAFHLLTGALVFVISMAIGTGWSLLLVGVAYGIVAAIVGWMAYSGVKRQGMSPRRTLQVLKEDKTWLQKEVRPA